ncbi:transmembrane protein, putative, partial [Bodo saltans]
ASAITFVVGDVGISGTLAVTNSFLGAILSPSDVSLSAAGFWIQTTNNIIAGTVLLLNTSIHVAVSSAPGVLAQGVTWGGALWDVAADTLFIGGNGAWNVTRCALDVQTSLVAATNAVGVYIRGVLSLYGTAQFMIDQTSVHVLTDHDEDSGVAEGVHFGFVRLTRGSTVTFMDSTWNVTSLVGNATMLYVPINGRFPSLFLLYRNKVYVNAPTANTTASFMITYGVMTMESQMLIHSNTIEVLTNATDSITIAPVGVRVSSMEATIDPVVTSQLLYGGTLDDGMFNISIGGSFSLVDSNFTFGDALLPIAVDGPLDIIFNLYPGCFMQLQGLRLTGGPGVVLLSRSFVKVFPTEVNGYSFTLGCLGVNDDYPANILSQYMYNDVLDVITAVPYCDCATSASALGTATTISGIYPNCVFTCQRASSNPISLLRERCAAPTFFSVSATITTKTMPPVQTATTYTDFISETKRSLTLSNSTTLPQTTSPIPSKSLSVPLTPTVKLTPSPTLIASPSRTKTLKPNTFSHSLSASREVSATKSRSLLPSQTHDLNLTDSISMSLSVSHSRSQLQATISKELTRLTMFLSPSKGSQTPTDTLTFELNVTKTRYGHSRTLTFPVPPPPFNFLVQSQALGFLTLALTSISTILSSNPTVILTQFVAVMGQIYLTSDNAYQRTLPMAYILSPFWDYSKVVVAVANVLIILGVVVIHFLLSKFDVVGKIRGAPSVETVPSDPPRVVVPSDDNNDEEHDKKNQSTTSSERKPPSSVFAGPVVVQAEWVAAHFPELSFSLALVLYQGVVAAAFNIFFHESGASFVIGTMCLLFTIALPLVEYWILYGFLKVSMPPFTRVAYSSSASWWGRALPSGYWARCRAYASFGRIFNTMTDLGVKFTAYIFVVVLLVNAVAAVYASDQSERNGQYGVLGVLFLAGGLFRRSRGRCPSADCDYRSDPLVQRHVRHRHLVLGRARCAL